jgi:hypothetical protein
MHATQLHKTKAPRVTLFSWWHQDLLGTLCFVWQVGRILWAGGIAAVANCAQAHRLSSPAGAAWHRELLTEGSKWC